VPVRLRVLEGPNQGTVYFLGAGESKVIGRSGTADITIADPLLSRHHLMVRGSQEGGVLLDLDSSNGTFVNGRLIRETPLASGDKVKLGGVLLGVELEGRAPIAPGSGDKVETVRALIFCSRCMRAVNAGNDPPHPTIAFVCPACRSGEKTLDPDVIDGYKLLRKIADDPDGPVYKAEQKSLGREAIVRFFAPSMGTVDLRVVEQFMREAALAGRLSHPGVVETIDAGERRGVYFMVHESLEGGDLGARLKAAGGPLPIDEALSIAAKTAAALEYAHGQGIVHRNVRPASIFLGAYGVVKLGDFALARALAGQISPSAATRPTEWRGEANYTPAEQLASSTASDHRADIYALGAVLYHALSGHAPFEAPTPMRVVRRIGENDLTPLAELAPQTPKVARALVERCMEREPGRRFQSAHELREAIEQCRAKLGLRA